MIDPATGWFEVREIPDKSAITVANQVEQAWLTRYPWPTQLIYDRGSEFLGDFAEMIRNDYGVKRKPTTVRNPQANSIVERVHQTLGNIIRTFKVQETDVDENDPWSGILAATMFAIRSTYHTTLQATPAQLVFGRDAILNVQYKANWTYIKERKQKLINENNRRENAKRQPYSYEVGDKILIRDAQKHKFGRDPYAGPYVICRINDNGTIQYQKGVTRDTVNIRNVHPYHE